MVDAQVSDACDLIIVRVQISLFAPSKQQEKTSGLFFVYNEVENATLSYF